MPCPRASSIMPFGQVDPRQLTVRLDKCGEWLAQSARAASEVENSHPRTQLEELDDALSSARLPASHDAVEPLLVRPAAFRLNIAGKSSFDFTPSSHSCSNQAAAREFRRCFAPRPGCRPEDPSPVREHRHRLVRGVEGPSETGEWLRAYRWRSRWAGPRTAVAGRMSASIPPSRDGPSPAAAAASVSACSKSIVELEPAVRRGPSRDGGNRRAHPAGDSGRGPPIENRQRYARATLPFHSALQHHAPAGGGAPGTGEGLPVGIQVAGRSNVETLRAAAWLEQEWKKA